MKKFHNMSVFGFLIFFITSFFTSCMNEEPIADLAEEPDSQPPFEIFDCAKCDYIVDAYKIDGDELNIEPGDVICFQSGVEYGKTIFENIKGLVGNPVIIRNCGGIAVVNSTSSDALTFYRSNNFKLLGDGGGGDYGLKVTTGNSFYISMRGLTTDFEIAHLEIAGRNPDDLTTDSGFAGIGIKTSPYEDCELFSDPTRQAWIMKNIIIRDNYIHDVGGEGLYIGHGFYKGRIENGCSQMTYSHSIQHVRIYNNIIENTGYDGIQIKNTDHDIEVYNNTVTNYGKKGKGAHNEGLFLGEGVVGKFFNNTIKNGTGNGIMYQGMGNTDIYNNIVVNSGDYGFVAYHGSQVVRLADGYFNIFNNTIINSGQDGFIFYNSDGGVKRAYNNIVVKAGGDLLNDGNVDASNNLLTQNIDEVKFVNPAAYDFMLQHSSPAIDAGKNLKEFNILSDFLNNPRPKGDGYDVGAYEVQ